MAGTADKVGNWTSPGAVRFAPRAQNIGATVGGQLYSADPKIASASRSAIKASSNGLSQTSSRPLVAGVPQGPGN
jgi:hypothetical protein